MARFSRKPEAFAVLARRLQVTQEQLTTALQNMAIVFADTEALCLRLPPIAIDFGRSEMLNLDAIKRATAEQKQDVDSETQKALLDAVNWLNNR